MLNKIKLIPKFFSGEKVKILKECFYFDKGQESKIIFDKEKIGIIQEDYLFELPDFLIKNHSLKILIENKIFNIRMDCLEKL